MPKHRLVLLPNWMGDSVMAEPALRALAKAQPEWPLFGAGPAVATTVLAGQPTFAGLKTINDRGLFGPLTAGRSLRADGVQEVLLLRNSTRSALVARATGASTRIGYRKDGRGALLTKGIAPPSRSTPISAVDYYANLVEEAFSISVTDRTPRLDVSEAERAGALEVLDGLPRPIVGLVPGGNKPAKRWPAESFSRAAEALSKSFGGSTILFGAPSEREILAQIAGATSSPLKNLLEAGLGLDALRGVIAASDLIISNDTGPRHLAAACGTPAIALFGPTDHRWTTLPGVDESLLLAEPFIDEAHMADEHPQTCRIERISVGDVVFHASRRLEELSDSQHP